VTAWLAALLAAGPPQQQPPVFRAELEVVYVDVFVTSRGEPVTGLTTQDFVLTDNGVRQDVTLVDVDTVGVDAVLAFDVSASVAGPKVEHLKAAGRAFVGGLTGRDRAALLPFSHEIRLAQPPSADAGALRSTLDGLSARGGTAVLDALYLCLKRRWGTGRPLVVLFTDGEDTTSWLDNEDVLAAAREAPVLVQVVATEEAPSESPTMDGRTTTAPEPGHLYLLRQVAETTGGRLWYADSTDRLGSTLLAILEAMKTRYLLSYQPRGVPREGRHRIKVSVQSRGADVRARQEYVVPAQH
jgi:VWFA-related protein